MNKYSQLLKKLGLSAAALALSATLAVDSASAADENATDETVEQNVEADTTTEEKTEVVSEEKATEATTEEAVEEKAPEETQPEETQPEQTDRLLGRTPIPHVNYNHAYFTHRTSDTVGTIFHRIILSFYINGEKQSGDYIQIYSKPNTYGLTYDQLRDKVESRINQYQELGYELVQLDDSPYDNYYNYYFVDADKLSTDGETPEKPAAPAKEEQKPEAKPEERKPAADKKEESFDDLRPLEELPLGGHASSFDKNGFPINWSEAKKQAYIEKFGLPKGAKEAGKKDSASKAKANQHDSKWGAFGTEENATRYAVGEFYGNGFKELTNLTQAQRGEIEERLGAAKTMAEFEAIVADAKRMNSGQPQSNQAQSGQAQQQQDAQKQEARGERLPDTATGAWALGAVGLSTILAGLGIKKFKKD
ncbi:hypothetical protein [Dolosigranulum pigrum]|uniref:Gram-positive cocci surface proteins LPxTG domain-containing protein n=1 Tax=Dolosigranulum pigrum TaxID=29394 RepID=A0A516GH89_9LACT|nr:hypothetical protein [Dolosigranulum pigrum]QDO90852.1 hypothetical protein FNV33_01830 [Dolosigranulum pigrum]